MIPKDPFMLLSWINTQLRDSYPTLDELCQSFDLDRKALETALDGSGFQYDPQGNRFV